ncbi:MAG TPA: Trm112 family protein [Thermomicrobiaceae bacterium]|nr:Trm112 family protein [Thermomicrobiaceae bacterium]
MSENETPVISPELLEILACPVCKTPVRLEGTRLVCDNCGRRYRIEDGIPIMLIDEAELPGEASH